MLKIKDEINLKDLKKYGFDANFFHDGWAMVKEYRKGKYYRENIYIWSDRIIQTNAIILNDTLYDLIKADLVEKVESEE